MSLRLIVQSKSIPSPMMSTAMRNATRGTKGSRRSVLRSQLQVEPLETRKLFAADACFPQAEFGLVDANHREQAVELSSVEFDTVGVAEAQSAKPKEVDPTHSFLADGVEQWMGIDPEGKTTEEKMALHRKYREDRYEKLVDAVYKRRGWTRNGVPKIEHLKELGMDLPELIELVKPHQEA